MQQEYIHRPLSVARIDAELTRIAREFDSCETVLSDVELLSSAVLAAQAAADQGLILGSLDECGLRRAEQAARLADSRRVRRVVVAVVGAA
jgi:type IV secretory pathway VirJ component